MNPTTTFERALERWLDGEARGRARDGLHESVIERAATMRQRPAWFAALRDGAFPRSPSTSRRGATPAWRDLRFAFAVAAVVVAVGAGLVFKLSPAVTGGPSLVPGPSASVEPSGTPRPAESSAAVQPKLAMVAFVRGEYVGQVWVADETGTGARQLAPDLAGSQTAPSWSPDGTRVLFSLSPIIGMGYPSGSWLGARLYLADPSGGVPELVDTGCVAPCLGDGDGAFSPDGTRIAFIRNDSRLGRIVATIDLSTGRVTELTSTTVPAGNFPGGDPGTYSPRWSPDGTQIVFAQDVSLTAQNTSPVGGPSPALFVVDADGRNLHQISPACACHEDWSSDGTLIVFDIWSVTGRANQGNDVYTVRPDGTGRQRLTTDRISSFPSWTADGRIRFLKVPMTNGDPNTMQPPQFWLMDSDGANATRPSLAPLLQQIVLGYAVPVWQPTP